MVVLADGCVERVLRSAGSSIVAVLVPGVECVVGAAPAVRDTESVSVVVDSMSLNFVNKASNSSYFFPISVKFFLQMFSDASCIRIK